MHSASQVVIQRCQAHKLRNVEEHLHEVMRPSVRKAIQQAHRSRNAERAKRLLGNLVRRLEDEHPGATASLEEGLDETLMGFGLPLDDKCHREPNRHRPRCQRQGQTLAKCPHGHSLDRHRIDRG
jgi:transposase-like protein